MNNKLKLNNKFKFERTISDELKEREEKSPVEKSEETFQDRLDEAIMENDDFVMKMNNEELSPNEIRASVGLKPINDLEINDEYVKEYCENDVKATDEFLTQLLKSDDIYNEIAVLRLLDYLTGYNIYKICKRDLKSIPGYEEVKIEYKATNGLDYRFSLPIFESGKSFVNFELNKEYLRSDELVAKILVTGKSDDNE